MDRPRPRSDRDLRELLLYLRDTFQDAATRIDAFLAAQEGGPPRERAPRPPQGQEWPRREERRDFRSDRDTRGNERDPRAEREPRMEREPRAEREPRTSEREGREAGVRFPLEQLREEVRWISGEAGGMDPALLRLYVEAVTAETRSLQNRAADPEDSDIAAKIMRALTAIVSDHRPGHVYGLARHHQADWDDVARRARAELRGKSGGAKRAPAEESPRGEPERDDE